jgi:hypothetical protein
MSNEKESSTMLSKEVEPTAEVANEIEPLTAKERKFTSSIAL